jgi:hypothetical protein
MINTLYFLFLLIKFQGSRTNCYYKKSTCITLFFHFHMNRNFSLIKIYLISLKLFKLYFLFVYIYTIHNNVDHCLSLTIIITMLTSNK